MAEYASKRLGGIGGLALFMLGTAPSRCPKENIFSRKQLRLDDPDVITLSKDQYKIWEEEWDKKRGKYLEWKEHWDKRRGVK